MKKFLLAAISFGLAFIFSACSDDSSSGTESENKSGETGDFGDFSTIDKDAQEILAEAIKGTDYEDAECDSVSTQVVAGTNYKFQCSVKDGKKTKDVVLTVFEPLPSSDASVQLTFVTDSDGEVLFENPVEFEDEGDEIDEGEDSETAEPKDDEKSEKADAKDDKKSKNEKSDEDADSETVEPIAVVDPEEGAVACDGCYGDFKELTAADSAVFEKANKVSDSTFVNPTTVSKQVVAGMNYRFTCELEVSEGETKSVILEVYKNLKDEVEITAVAEIPEAPLQEKLDPSAEGVERDCGDSEGDAVTNCAVKIGLEN